MYYSLLLHTKLSFSIRPRKAFSNFEGPQRVIGIYLELGLLEIKVIVYKSCGEPFLLMQCTTKFIRPKHGRQKVHDYFYYCSVNHQSGLQSINTFSKLSCFFWYMCRKLCHLIWGIWWFHRSKEFEAMKAGMLAIRPWLSCPYNEHTLVDLPSSMYLE